MPENLPGEPVLQSVLRWWRSVLRRVWRKRNVLKKILAFSGLPHYNDYTRCRCEMNFETQNLVIYYDLRRESCRELASDAAFLSAYAGIRISMGMI